MSSLGVSDSDHQVQEGTMEWMLRIFRNVEGPKSEVLEVLVQLVPLVGVGATG
jgi:hypothetical protein